jgi:hypothetical protein
MVRIDGTPHVDRAGMYAFCSHKAIDKLKA